MATLKGYREWDGPKRYSTEDLQEEKREEKCDEHGVMTRCNDKQTITRRRGTRLKFWWVIVGNSKCCKNPAISIIYNNYVNSTGVYSFLNVNICSVPFAKFWNLCVEQ